MSFLSLADDTLTVGSLPLPLVKSLVLGDITQFSEAHPTINSVTDKHWAVFKNRFNTKSFAELSGGTSDAFKLRCSAITDDQETALAETRKLVRGLLSQSVGLSSKAHENLEAEEDIEVAKESIREVLAKAASTESDKFWGDHLADARFGLHAIHPGPEANDHIKQLFGSYIRASPGLLLQSLNANTTGVTSQISQYVTESGKDEVLWSMLRGNWAESVRDTLKTELGVDVRAMSSDAALAVLQSEEGIKAAHWASGAVISAATSFAKLAENQSEGLSPDAPKTGLDMLLAKVSEVESLVAQGKLKSYKNAKDSSSA